MGDLLTSIERYTKMRWKRISQCIKACRDRGWEKCVGRGSFDAQHDALGDQGELPTSYIRCQNITTFDIVWMASRVLHNLLTHHVVHRKILDFFKNTFYYLMEGVYIVYTTTPFLFLQHHLFPNTVYKHAYVVNPKILENVSLLKSLEG